MDESKMKWACNGVVKLSMKTATLYTIVMAF